MEPIEAEVYRGHRIEIHPDDDVESPRGWDPIGNMLCWHRRHALGDKHNFASPSDFQAWLDEEKPKLVMLPLYLYDHGGLTVNTTGFSCQWDSGQVGFIYVLAEDVLKEFKDSPEFKKEVVAATLSGELTETLVKEAKRILIGEVAVYDQYLQGDVYGYKVFEGADEDSEEVDSCWGCYGLDYCRSQAREAVDALVRARKKRTRVKVGGG